MSFFFKSCRIIPAWCRCTFSIRRLFKENTNSCCTTSKSCCNSTCQTISCRCADYQHFLRPFFYILGFYIGNLLLYIFSASFWMCCSTNKFSYLWFYYHAFILPELKTIMVFNYFDSQNILP